MRPRCKRGRGLFSNCITGYQNNYRKNNYLFHFLRFNDLLNLHKERHPGLDSFHSF